MLTNATLLRVDTPSGSTPGGNVIFATGAALSVRCFVREETSSDDYPNPAELTESRQMLLRVMASDLARASLSLATEQQITLQLDGDAPAPFNVIAADRRPKGALSFVECKLLRS